MKKSLEAFGRNEKGSVAIIFALSLIPVLGVSGIAVDYSRLHVGRSSLQDVVDGAAVAIARYPGTLTKSEAKKLARQYVKAHLQEENVTLGKVDVSLTDTAISVTGSISMPTTFMGLFGYKTMETAALGEVVWSSAMHYEIALVLDNTGSMEGTKMTELKKAANTFIDLVTQRVPDKDNLKIGVVPFSTFVNVGKGYKDASWIDVDGKSKVSSDMFD
ncbi:MAG TPA: pilus assembly protein, partial [Hyphomicrobiales bacterium]|nr:pilus assembly protein [Hyphomicrobiales bacterium]